MNESIYPIKPSEQEALRIKQFLEKRLETNVQEAEQERPQIRKELGTPTEMLNRKRDYFAKVFDSVENLYFSIESHQWSAVLLVSAKFLWHPADILALWQNEGLPSPSVKKFERMDTEKIPLLGFSNWYGEQPKTVRQARSWARSAVLWERFGLDRLAPIVRRPGRENLLKDGLSAKRHDEAFNKGFKNEIGNLLPENPLQYLNQPTLPIFIAKKRYYFAFRTHPEYLPTMLALQCARFHNQINRIPEKFEFGNTTVHTRSVAPLFLYMHYNSQGAERHLERTARMMVNVYKRKKMLKTEYDGDDLYEFFVMQPIPKDIQSQVDSHYKKTNFWNRHSWVNSLRFEYLRRLYRIVFSGW